MRQIGISDMYNLKSCKYGQRAVRGAGRAAAEGGRRAPARLTPVGLFSLLFYEFYFHLIAFEFPPPISAN